MELPSIVFHDNLANGCPHKFLSRYHRILNVCAGFQPFVSWKTCPHNILIEKIRATGSVFQFFI